MIASIALQQQTDTNTKTRTSSNEGSNPSGSAINYERVTIECSKSVVKKPRFNGSDYSPEHDDARLSRQLDKVFNVVRSQQWYTLEEISTLTGAPQASVSAQLRHLKKPRFGSFQLEKRPRGDRKNGLWEYRLLPPLSTLTEPNAESVSLACVKGERCAVVRPALNEAAKRGTNSLSGVIPDSVTSLPEINGQFMMGFAT